jgi:agmatine/peptidylarginine deiminase
MISDNQTNKVYFSEILRTDSKFAATCNEITKILDSFEVRYAFLEKTKDIWARDYMPIQVSEDKFVEYRYDPDYLQGIGKERRNIKTYPDIVCDDISIKTIKSDIILDGGNVIKSNNCLILTDKIVKENRFLCEKDELIKRLEGIFEVDHVLLIPWDKVSIYGHSDGMLRFIDKNTVLVHEIYESESLQKQLSVHGLKWKYLQFDVKLPNEDLNWAYINFLQTKDLILLPKLNIEEDEQAFEQMKKYYPDYARNNRIAQVDMTEIVNEGGALNCISWTIKTK